jgi:hypothetical protein
MKKYLLFFTAVIIIFVSTNTTAKAQQYKLRQSAGMMGMKSESTIYVKGMRKRTESAGMMGMPAPPITIEQCDLQRTIKINDKKRLYFIEPFVKDTEEVIDEDVKPAAKTKPVTPPQPKEKTPLQKGGIITMWYSITDTGERKKIYGFTARHVWTSQKMVPSPDACTMKDSIQIKTDGWYIDLPEFNCPVRYRPATVSRPTERPQPDCKDRFITRRKGKGKLGFPLTETTTIIMGDGSTKKTEFETSIETLELTSGKLDSMLFEIPIGYTQTMNEEDLQEKFDIGDMMKEAKKTGKENNSQLPIITGEKKPGIIRIGVFEPKGDEQLQTSSLQQHLVGSLTGGKIEAIAITSAEDAKKYNCDYTLTSDFIKIKQATKVGGLLKVIKNADPNAASSFNIEANLNLISVSDGSTRLQPKVSGKYDGKIDDAAKKALDEGSGQVLKGLK